MKNLKRWALCSLAVMMLIAGCSKKDKDTTEGVENTQESEIDQGEISTLGTYKGVEVTKMSTEVTDEELETSIQGILDANPERIAITDRPAELGDIANIDFVGLLNGEAFEGGTSAGYELELGSGSFIEGFEEGIVGANVGDELSLNLTFPETYHSEDLAGKEVVFEVTLNSLEKKEAAILDNNFVQRMSDFTTVDEFKADTLADLEANKEEQAKQQAENDAITAAIENSEYAINQDAVETICDQQIEYYRSAYPQMYGMELTDYLNVFGQTEEEYREELKVSIEQSLKWELLVEAIAEKEGFTVEDADLEKLASEYQMTIDELKAQYGEESVQLGALKNKVYWLIVDNAVVK